VTHCLAMVVEIISYRCFLSSDKYGFHVLALTHDPSNTLGASNPFAVGGYYEFHGDGTLNGADTVSRNGESHERTPERIR